jgi:hypothetical protein
MVVWLRLSELLSDHGPFAQANTRTRTAPITLRVARVFPQAVSIWDSSYASPQGAEPSAYED